MEFMRPCYMFSILFNAKKMQFFLHLIIKRYQIRKVCRKIPINPTHLWNFSFSLIKSIRGGHWVSELSVVFICK